MKILLSLLEEIYALLEQIHTITTNQTTILLQPKETNEEENIAIDLIDSMVEYKDEIIKLVTDKEKEFEDAYSPLRGKITQEDDVIMIKEAVNKVMNKKQEIVESEKNNMRIMQNLGKKKEKVTHISPTANKVVTAYKKTTSENIKNDL